MNKRLAAVCFLAAMFAGGLTFAFSGLQSERKTVWAGVYTETQATRGEQEYLSNCSPCHGVDLEGVANLRGPDFMDRWREFDVRSLYDFVSQSMPRVRTGSSNKPGSLSETTYISILAHIFRSNNFPAGSDELSPPVMKSIRIEEKEGPKRIPNSALVQTVGCMTRRGAEWLLTDASEPARTIKSSTSTEEELQDARLKPLGQLRFSLANFGYLGAEFDPTQYAGHRLQVKGFVVWQPARNRINITSLESLRASCP